MNTIKWSKFGRLYAETLIRLPKKITLDGVILKRKIGVSLGGDEFPAKVVLVEKEWAQVLTLVL